MAFGIICEYNPLHTGHLHQINEIKRISDEPIICVMSGHLTQRGEIAIFDKYARAEMALQAGADVVLELPVPFCASSAEYFAAAGVHILWGVGVDKLCFGSESADADEIMRVARIAASDEFRAECANASLTEQSTAAYFDLLQKRSGAQNILSNDILGIEYTKAIIKNGYEMKIYPIKREGNLYNETELKGGKLPSASAIREKLTGGRLSEIAEFVPASTLQIMEREEASSIEYAKDAILMYLRLFDSSNLDIAVSDVGLINRITSCAARQTTFDGMLGEVQTKKYTRAAIRRAILYMLLGVKNTDLQNMPTYTGLLGANARGREYLSDIRKKEYPVRVITKPADAPDGRQKALSLRADALYTACFKEKRESGYYMKKTPIII